jgi:hypothetical protein
VVILTPSLRESPLVLGHLAVVFGSVFSGITLPQAISASQCWRNQRVRTDRLFP